LKAPQENLFSSSASICHPPSPVETVGRPRTFPNQGSSLTVSVVASLNAFRRLKNRWNALLERSHSNCIFLTWEWLFTWWKWYGNNSDLFILVIQDQANQIRGIAPLMARRTAAVFRRLQLIGSDSKVCSDFLDIIAEKGWEKHVAKCIMRFLVKTRSQWHVFVLSSIPSDSSFLAVLRRLPEFRRLMRHKKVQNTAPSLSYPGTWDKLLARFGRSTRKSITRKRRRIEKEFRVQFTPWSALFDRTQTINTVKRLQQKSISRKGLRGIFEDETYRNFHADIIDLFRREGWLYIVFLLCDGKPVAFLYAYLYGGKCYDYQRGFDTDYRSYSVGTVLQSYVFQDTISKGVRTYDFLRGGEEYKYRFANSAREMLQVSFFNNRWSSVLLRLMLTGSRQVKSHIADLLGKNLTEKIKVIKEASRVQKKKSRIVWSEDLGESH